MSDSLATPWTIAHQAPLPMKYWSVLPFPSPGIFPSQGLSPGLLHCRQVLYCLNQQGRPHLLWRYPSHWPGGGGVACPHWAGREASNGEASCFIAGNPVAGKPLGEQGSKCRPAWAWSLNACFSELLALVAVWFLYSVLVSTLQRREWAVCTHISLPPEPLSQCALWVITKPQDELPCVPAGSHQLSTLYVAVCACQPCAEMWVDLESVIASEVSQRKTNIV